MKVGVFIGRFQPFHHGHGQVVEKIANECDHTVIVVGSSNRHQSIKNPFSYRQREHLIRMWWGQYSGRKQSSLSIVPAPDNLYKDWTWKATVIQNVEHSVPSSKYVDREFILYGHHKDDSSYYLDLFPEWVYHPVTPKYDIDATNIRKTFFESGIVSSYRCVPETTADYLKSFKHTPKYDDLVEEWHYYRAEERKFSDYPYPQTLGFMCSDAVLVCQGQILMVERKHTPGKGTWALPGGFKDRNETFLDGCIRELVEETNVRVPEKVLRGSVKSSHMFDAVGRNLGTPRVSMAYHIEIAPNYDGTLPEVRPASDAENAEWMSFADVMNTPLFDDHLDIIKFFI